MCVAILIVSYHVVLHHEHIDIETILPVKHIAESKRRSSSAGWSDDRFGEIPDETVSHHVVSRREFLRSQSRTSVEGAPSSPALLEKFLPALASDLALDTDNIPIVSEAEGAGVTLIVV